ncbi:MAG: transglutaminase domain-containing protein [Promethearchaeota archaeon]
MSQDLEQELLYSGISKKRVLATIIIAGILISIFAFQTYLFSLILGTTKLNPNQQLEGTDEEDATLKMPPFPFNLDDLDIDPEDLEALADMFDGNIDDIDLSNYGYLLAALLGSEVEVFRVYDYDNFNNMSRILWRYECFDEFTGDSWQSTATKRLESFYTYTDYYDKHSSKDLMTIEMQLQPEIGTNSMVIPALFPRPFIMEDSFDATGLIEEQSYLFKDDLNCTTVDLYFTQTGNISFSYQLFGYPPLSDSDLDALNMSAVSATYTPSGIKTQFTGLPGGKTAYLNNNPNFRKHYYALEKIINPGDNAFVVANKIRNYLQNDTIFTFGTDALLNDGPGDNEDIVEWFCEKEEGIWNHYASAFCAFARAFGVPARFIDGFNSRSIEEKNDGKDYFQIKYKNMYNWAEIYVPTNVDGTGQWVEMDILYQSYGGGGNPLDENLYNITVTSNFTTGFRGPIANITAHLTTNIGSLDGKTITFTDLISGQQLGQATTNLAGRASIYLPIDNNLAVGPHFIVADYDYKTYADTNFTIYGPIQVNLTDINPLEINRTNSTAVNFKGFVGDPVNSIRLEGVYLNLNLFNKGTNNIVDPAFTSSITMTNQTGEFNFNTNVYTAPTLPRGEYDVMFNTTGSWFISGIHRSSTIYGFFNTLGSIYDESNRVNISITDEISKKVSFWINFVPASNDYNPLVNRAQVLDLRAKVVDEYNNPISNKIVQFYDYTNGDFNIGNDTTDATGYANISYDLSTSNVTAGPNLLYAKVNNYYNYSYFILNEVPSINITLGPSPQEINRSGSGITQFTIQGFVHDNIGNSVGRSRIRVELLRNGWDNSSYLQPSQPNPFITGTDGTFSLTFGVDPNTVPDNYSLKVIFDGNINFLNVIQKPVNFSLLFLQNSTNIKKPLKIEAPDIFSFNFYLNGIPNNNFNNPVINRFANVSLTAYVQWGSELQEGRRVYFYDETENISLGSSIINNRTTTVNFSTNAATTAGPHLIRARFTRWTSGPVFMINRSYYILNESIGINMDIGPNPRLIASTGAFNREFIIHGFVEDSLNLNHVKYGQISVHMFDATSHTEVFYLIQTGGTTQCNDTGEIFLKYKVSSLTPIKNYTIEVWFNGSFDYTGSAYPHFFNLNFFNRFSYAAIMQYELEIYNPEDLIINLKVEGQYSRSFYDDIYPPARYRRGIDNANFEVQINQTGVGVETGIVRILDVYNGNQILGVYTFIVGDKGYHQFILNTATWFAGLHYINVTYESSGIVRKTYNITYIIINETVNIFAGSNTYEIIRNTGGFTINGYIQESGIRMKGLRVRIQFFNSKMNNASIYFSLVGTKIKTINPNNGIFSFTINNIGLTCPYGLYMVRIEFNGSIDVPGAVALSNYMVSNATDLFINVTADTTIIEGSVWSDWEDFAPNNWIIGDNVHVNGTLQWDNGTGMVGYQVIISIRWASNGTWIDNTTVITGAGGYFEGILVVGADWPDLRSDTKIWVTYVPLPFQEIEGDEIQYS